MTKEALEQLQKTRPVKMLATIATTVSEGTTSTAAAEAAAVGANVVVVGTKNPALGTRHTDYHDYW